MAESHSTDGQSADDAEDRRRSRSAELLSKADLFSGVDRVTLAKLAAHLDPISFVKDGAACKQGEVGDSLYLVSEGAFGVFVSSDMTRVRFVSPRWGVAHVLERWRSSPASRARRLCWPTAMASCFASIRTAFRSWCAVTQALA